MNTKRPKQSSEPGSQRAPSPASAYGEMPRPAEHGDFSAHRQASIAGELRQTAQSAGRAAREQADAFASEIGQELGRKAEDEKSKGIEALQSFAAAIDTAAREMERQSPQVARYVHQAAERMHSLSSTIDQRSINDLMRNATDLARSRPGMFFAGAVAAGFALSRFLKSSARHEGAAMNEDEPWHSGGEGPQPGGRGQTGGFDHGNP